MIIKPLCQQEELEAYFRNRNKHQFTTLLDRNLSGNSDLEIDVYDFSSFHFAAFSEEEMIASCRVINGNFPGFKQEQEISKAIDQLTTRTSQKKKLQLLEFVKSQEESELLEFLDALEVSQCTYNEMSRLHKIKECDEKQIMNYIMCYALAFNRYHEIDFHFFDAPNKHCLYYERYFKCERIFEHIKFYPLKDKEPKFMMQANIANASFNKNVIINRIVNKFKKEGKPCAITLKEIK